jgi:hypothetical protein
MFLSAVKENLLWFVFVLVSRVTGLNYWQDYGNAVEYAIFGGIASLMS